MRVIGKKVLVKLHKAKDVSEGGIVIPDSAKEKVNTGYVVAIGEEVNKGCNVVRLNRNEIVYISDYGAYSVGKDLIVVNVDDILAIKEVGDE